MGNGNHNNERVLTPFLVTMIVQRTIGVPTGGRVF